MNKEQFLKELNKNLNHLSKKARKEELKEYENLSSYDLDPITEANKIYNKRGIVYTVKENISLFNAASILTNKLQSQDKESIKNILLFFLYLIFLLIIIKIPFIYVRDIISNMFSNFLQTENLYSIWYLIFELLYAITTILIFIRLIKNKALDIKESEQKKELSENK